MFSQKVGSYLLGHHLLRFHNDVSFSHQIRCQINSDNKRMCSWLRPMEFNNKMGQSNACKSIRYWSCSFIWDMIPPIIRGRSGSCSKILKSLFRVYFHGKRPMRRHEMNRGKCQGISLKVKMNMTCMRLKIEQAYSWYVSFAVESRPEKVGQ